jgi:hypothetical protein
MRRAAVPNTVVHDTALWSGGADVQLHLVAGVPMQFSIVGSSTASQQASSVASVASTALAQISSSTLPSESASTSGPAELFKKLEDLATSDPQKFKAVTKQLAAAVQDAADSATDPKEKQMLTDLANRFTEASQTGDASVLKPPEGGKPAGPPPGGPPPDGAGGSSDATSSSSASTSSTGSTQYAAADTNQDGTVTVEEQAAYDALHPSKAEQAYSSTMDQAREGRAQALFSTLQQIVAAAG